MSGTPFDFVDEDFICGKDRLGGAIDGGGMPGIDHAYLIDRSEGIDSNTFAEAGTLKHEVSGRQMKVFTTQPAAVIYTANWIPASLEDGIHR